MAAVRLSRRERKSSGRKKFRLKGNEGVNLIGGKNRSRLIYIRVPYRQKMPGEEVTFKGTLVDGT